jgi:hypothetical protein
MQLDLAASQGPVDARSDVHTVFMCAVDHTVNTQDSMHLSASCLK